MSRRLTAAAAVATALVLAVPAAPANAAPAVVATDPAGDVKVVDAGALSQAQLRSIDLLKVRVRVGASSTRFVVKIAGPITKSHKFEQMVFLTLRSPRSASPAYRTDIGMSAQSPKDSYANYTPDISGEDVVVCDPLTALVKPRAKALVLDVPQECIPAGPVKIRVSSATGAFRSEGPGNSRDAMPVKGTFTLR